MNTNLRPSSKGKARKSKNRGSKYAVSSDQDLLLASMNNNAGGSNSTAATTGMNQQMLFQLQQQMAMSQNNITPQPPAVASDDFTARIERKEAVYNQLGQFLNQMQAESAVTSEAYKQKVNEITTLKQANVSLTEQLEDAREAEADAAQVATELQAKIASMENSFTTSQLTEKNNISLLSNELAEARLAWKEKESEYKDRLSASEKREVAHSSELNAALANIKSLTDAKEQVEQHVKAQGQEIESQRKEFEATLNALNSHAKDLEAQKEELTQHLWGASNELKAKQEKLDEYENSSQAQQLSYRQTNAQLNAELKEAHGTHEELQQTLASSREDIRMLEGRLENEKRQKEELNEAVGKQMEMLSEEIARLKRQNHQAIERYDSDIEAMTVQVKKSTESQSELTAQMQELKASLQDKEHEASVRANEADGLRKVANDTLRDLEHMQAAKEQLKRELDDAKASNRTLLVDKRDVENAGSRMCISVGVNDKAFPGSLEQWIVTALDKISTLSASKEAYEEASVKTSGTVSKQQQELEKLQTKLSQCEAELETAKTDAASLVDTITQLKEADAKKQELVAELQEAVVNVQSSASTETQKIEKQYENQRSRVNTLESEKQELLSEAGYLNQELLEARAEKSRVEGRLEDELSLRDTQARKLEGILEEKQEVESALQDVRASMEAMTLEFNKKHHDALEEVQAATNKTLEAQAEFEKQTQVFERQLSDLASDARSSREENEKLMDTINNKSKKLQEAAVVTAELRQDLMAATKAKSNDESRLMRDLEKYQEQCRNAGHEVSKLEVAIEALTAQNEQLSQDLRTSRDDKRAALDNLHHLDHELEASKANVAQKEAELERMTKSRDCAQSDTDRVTDEYNEILRQFEVSRRKVRQDAKAHDEEIESLRYQIANLTQEASDASSVADELQNKIGSIQSSSQGTINELMAELKDIEETLRHERLRNTKEIEKLRNQLKVQEEEASRSESSTSSVISQLRQDVASSSDTIVEKEAAISKLSRALDAKRIENDRLTAEVADREGKVNDQARTISSLRSTKKLAEEKAASLKSTLDSRIREFQDAEDKYLATSESLKREKREIETALNRMRDDSKNSSSSSSTDGSSSSSSSSSDAANHREIQMLKSTLDRTKTELVKSSNDLSALQSRLESTQEAANATIAGLKGQLLAVKTDHEVEITKYRRQLEDEEERRKTAEADKMELSHLVRNSTPGGAEDVNWDIHRGSSRSSKTSSAVKTSSRDLFYSQLDHHPETNNVSSSRKSDRLLPSLNNSSTMSLRNNIELYAEEEDPHYMGTRSEADMKRNNVMNLTHEALAAHTDSDSHRLQVPELELSRLNDPGEENDDQQNEIYGISKEQLEAIDQQQHQHLQQQHQRRAKPKLKKKKSSSSPYTTTAGGNNNNSGAKSGRRIKKRTASAGKRLPKISTN